MATILAGSGADVWRFVLGPALMAIGAILAGIAAARAMRRKKREKGFSKTAAATATGLKKTGAGPRGWSLEYEFETADGKTASATSKARTGRGKALPLVGAKRIVLYDPGDPGEIYVPAEAAAAYTVDAAVFASGLTFMTLGGVFAFAAILSLA